MVCSRARQRGWDNTVSMILSIPFRLKVLTRDRALPRTYDCLRATAEHAGDSSAQSLPLFRLLPAAVACRGHRPLLAQRTYQSEAILSNMLRQKYVSHRDQEHQRCLSLVARGGRELRRDRRCHFDPVLSLSRVKRITNAPAAYQIEQAFEDSHNTQRLMGLRRRLVLIIPICVREQR